MVVCDGCVCVLLISPASSSSGFSAPLQLGVDESYTIDVDPTSSPPTATLQATTVWGALHGLQTFLSLVTCTSGQCSVPGPVTIGDTPLKPHRGVMIDTARHYLSPTTIQQVIDGMSRIHLNTLHIHITDAIATPVQSTVFPDLVKGAYSPSESYSMYDLTTLVTYGMERGVRLVPEIDVPGHAYAFGIGYPAALAKCPPDLSENLNNFPLDISKEFTMMLVTQLNRELSQVFTDSVFHTGGDEVVTSCWTGDPDINRWLQDHDLTVGEAFTQFVSKVDANLTSLGRTSTHWWNSNVQAGAPKLPSDSIFQVWRSLDDVADAVATGHRVVVSPSSSLYLNCGFNPACAYTSWEDVYNTDITSGVPASKEHLVIGAEAVMFGEFADDTNLSVQMWPRAAALAQSLWSGQSVSVADLGPMLHNTRCRFVAAGIPATPTGPGYCEDLGQV